MTLGEIQAVIWAKTRSTSSEIDYDDLLNHLQEMKESDAGRNR